LGGERSGLQDAYTVLAAPMHPDSRKLIEFWEAHRSDGIVIGRDVPSRTIAGLLSHIVIYEPVEAWNDLMVRLAGAAIRFRFGVEITGKKLSDLFGAHDFQDHLMHMRGAVEAKRPLIIESRLNSGAVEKLHSEVVIVPVLARDGVTPWVMVGIFYYD
jgi:hypothetical protein